MTESNISQLFSVVFQACSDKCLPRALHCEFTAEIALPLIALRSGHLLDEHASPCCGPASLQVPTRGPSAVRAAAASAPPSKPAAARQTRLRYAKRFFRRAKFDGLHQSGACAPARTRLNAGSGDAGS